MKEPKDPKDNLLLTISMCDCKEWKRYLKQSEFKTMKGFFNYMNKLIKEYKAISTGNTLGGGTDEYFFYVNPRRIPKLLRVFRARMDDERNKSIHNYISLEYLP